MRIVPSEPGLPREAKIARIHGYIARTNSIIILSLKIVCVIGERESATWRTPFSGRRAPLAMASVLMPIM